MKQFEGRDDTITDVRINILISFKIHRETE